MIFILKIKQPSWYLNRHYYDKNEFELVYKEYFYKYVSFLKPDFNRNDKRIDRMFKLEKELAMVFNLTLLNTVILDVINCLNLASNK